ncbi:MAG TPA: amidohydrolase family protein [Planctomycetota bacterium]|nr:amidohydrolase family protein [Planctomycetota bacterium]
MSGAVDCHVHVQPWTQLRPGARAAFERGHPGFEKLERLVADPNAFASFLDGEGVAAAALINYPSPVMGFDASVNDFVAGYRDRRPERFLAFGGVHPPSTPRIDSEMDRLLERLRLDGVKVHPPHQGFAPNAYRDALPDLRTVYARCEAAGVPVMIHTGTSIFPGARSRLGEPMAVDDVAVDFPNLRIVLAHGGRPLWPEGAFFLLRRHENCWLDLSGIPPRRILESFPRLTEVEDRVLFGTDWPSPGVPGIGENLRAFLALPLPEATKRKVVAENARRLFPRLAE